MSTPRLLGAVQTVRVTAITEGAGARPSCRRRAVTVVAWAGGDSRAVRLGCEGREYG